MYEFVDTNKAGSKSSLPSEALQIDGAYIENLIDGYRTLYVTGRELLGSEISEREIDLVDGSEYLESEYNQKHYSWVPVALYISERVPGKIQQTFWNLK